MTIDDMNILWLDIFETLTIKKKTQLLEIAGRGKDIRQIFLSNDAIKHILTAEEHNKMALCLHESFLQHKLEEYKNCGVECVTFFDALYPYLLKEIANPPLCLYCKGNTQLLNTKCFAIVGSRMPSEYGQIVTKQFAKAISNAGLTVVSGLAAGVDTISHKTALEEGGNTIAVLAGGVNKIYPAFNTNLAKQIVENNLILSEFPPDFVAQAYHFPMRNRIISGLSVGTLVTEASDKSGSLHTINYAIEQGRDIYAIPGRINSPLSKGTNELIKKYSTAFTTEPEDILNNYNLENKKNPEKPAVQLDITVQSVLNYIQTDKKTFQEIKEYTNLETKQLNSILLELEMAGLVTKLANNSYIMS